MNKIHQLPQHIIAKISAGEVIERPAYAIKELMENAIDAKADEIIIHLEKAGFKKIMVIDNGEGMSKDDLKESSKPHTTSKLFTADDLMGIKTLGFRGEALASLAAVSNLTIKSRLHTEKIGNQIEINNSKEKSFTPVGMAPGTTVIVENLFASVPARKKFLKSVITEFRHSMNVITHIALSHPDIHIIVKHNNKTIFDLTKTDSKERILQLLGIQLNNQLLPVTFTDNYVTVSGYIAKPQFATSSSTKQYLFVNNRYVIDKQINHLVKKSFGTILASTSYPIFILFISLPYDLVDINVHPKKEVIQFIHPKNIFEKIQSAITQTLEKYDLTYNTDLLIKDDIRTTKTDAAEQLREIVLTDDLFSYDETKRIFQLHKTYIIEFNKQGIIITDQHAAHERILFEKLQKEFISQRKKSQTYTLKQPIVLHLPINEIILLEEHQKDFIQLGFTINKTTNEEVTVTHVPLFLKDRHPQQLIQELLDSFSEEKSVELIDSVSHKMIAYLACRAATKAGDELSEIQMKEILKQLEISPNNTTCPHGRPTRIALPIRQLHRMFKRD